MRSRRRGFVSTFSVCAVILVLHHNAADILLLPLLIVVPLLPFSIMVKIVDNVGGVPGLDLAMEAFSEDVERRLFESNMLFHCTPQEASRGDKREGIPTGP